MVEKLRFYCIRQRNLARLKIITLVESSLQPDATPVLSYMCNGVIDNLRQQQLWDCGWPWNRFPRITHSLCRSKVSVVDRSKPLRPWMAPTTINPIQRCNIVVLKRLMRKRTTLPFIGEDCNSICWKYFCPRNEHFICICICICYYHILFLYIECISTASLVSCFTYLFWYFIYNKFFSFWRNRKHK